MARISSSSSGSGPGLFSSLVFQPGGTAGLNTYTDWSLLYAALSLLQGARQVFFDSTFTTPEIPAGTYDLTGVTFIGNLQEDVVNLDDGCVFTAFPDTCNFLTLNSNSNSPVYTVGSTVVFIQMNSTTLQASGSAPMISVPTGTALGMFLNFGTFAGGNTILDVEGQVLMFGLDATQIADTISGSSSGLVSFDVDASSIITVPQSAFSGAISVNFIDDSSQIRYGSGNSSLNASIVKDALDEIATGQQPSYITYNMAGGNFTVPYTQNAPLVPIMPPAIILTNATTVVSFTLTLPAAPPDGQLFSITTQRVITSFTLNGNGSGFLVAPPTSLTIGQILRYRFVSILGQWCPA